MRRGDQVDRGARRPPPGPRPRCRAACRAAGPGPRARRTGRRRRCTREGLGSRRVLGAHAGIRKAYLPFRPAGPAVSVPPPSAARSRRPVSPYWAPVAASGPPAPGRQRVDHLHRDLGRRELQAEPDRLARRVLARVGQRLLGGPVGGQGRLGGDRPRRPGHGEVHGQVTVGLVLPGQGGELIGQRGARHPAGPGWHAARPPGPRGRTRLPGRCTRSPWPARGAPRGRRPAIPLRPEGSPTPPRASGRARRGSAGNPGPLGERGRLGLGFPGPAGLASICSACSARSRKAWRLRPNAHSPMNVSG